MDLDYCWLHTECFNCCDSARRINRRFIFGNCKRDYLMPTSKYPSMLVFLTIKVLKKIK